MSRYIDAEVALQSFCAECNHKIKCEDCDIKYHLETFVPTADVQEIKRGRWISRKYCSNYSGYDYAMKCSVCHKPLYRQFSEKMPNYCPNCGAKMVDVDEVEE